MTNIYIYTCIDTHNSWVIWQPIILSQPKSCWSREVSPTDFRGRSWSPRRMHRDRCQQAGDKVQTLHTSEAPVGSPGSWKKSPPDTNLYICLKNKKSLWGMVITSSIPLGLMTKSRNGNTWSKKKQQILESLRLEVNDRWSRTVFPSNPKQTKISEAVKRYSQGVQFE